MRDPTHKPTKSAGQGSEELVHFANSFSSEIDLQQRLESLFSKVPTVSGVKTLQGTQEYGKDLVFYEVGASGKKKLTACVVKKGRISGSVGSASGASTVYHQVRQAFSIPYVNQRGEHEFVSYVYVVSPLSCSQEAINSIRGELRQSANNVEFVCGRDLFDLFNEWWPAYIFVDSNLLSIYLASLRNLDSNTSLANAMTRAGFTTSGVDSLSRMYVHQTFMQRLSTFELINPLLNWHELEGPLNWDSVQAVERQLQSVIDALTAAQTWSDLSEQRVKNSILALGALRRELQDTWFRKLNERVREVHTVWTAEREAEKKKAEKKGRPVVGSKSPPDIKKTFSCVVFNSSAQPLVDEVYRLWSDVRKCGAELNMLIRASRSQEKSDLLGSQEYLIFSRFVLASIACPGALRASSETWKVEFPRGILSQYSGPLLIANSAGYGKTSFCRVAALADAEAILHGEARPLPIYVPLHQFNSANLRDDVDLLEVIVPEKQLREFITTSVKNRELPLARIYLDGLDELVLLSARDRLMVSAERLSTEGLFQVVATTREYVAGTSLKWMPRVSLAPFESDQIEELAGKWLTVEELRRFESQLTGAPELRKIMEVPLLANLTLAIFKQIGTIPESVARCYDMFVRLLCGGWDAAKNVRRESNFGAVPKQTVITRLAWLCHKGRKRDFSFADFRIAVLETLCDIESSAEELLTECLQDGVIIRTGTDYAFAHLSFQEFLASRHMNDPNGRRQAEILRRYYSGETWWEDVLIFYIASADDPMDIAKWISEGVRRARRTHDPDLHKLQQRTLLLMNATRVHHRGFQEDKEFTNALNRILDRS